MSKSIKILTYNICFECVSASSTFKSRSNSTVSKLSQYCYNKKTNVNYCLNNIIDIINHYNHDIIGLQEASKWHIIYKESNTLQNMSYIQSKSGQEDMITFYNKNRFDALAAMNGEMRRGRPYQILLLKDKNTNDYYIICNIHNGKEDPQCDKNAIEKQISQHIKFGVILSPQESIANLETHTKVDISYIINNKIFNTIILGDFNDLLRKQYFWKGLKLFKHSNFPNLKNIIVSTNNIKPPYTCCSINKNPDIKQFDFFGDYISIDNSQLTYKVNNRIHPGYANKISSDHLPIYAEIQKKSASNTQTSRLHSSHIRYLTQPTIPLTHNIQHTYKSLSRMPHLTSINPHLLQTIRPQSVPTKPSPSIQFPPHIRLPTSPIRPHTTPIRPHTLPIRPHTTPIRPHTIPIRLPSPPIRPHTIPIRLPTSPIRPHTTPIRLPTSPIRPHTTPIRPHTTPIRLPSPPIRPPTSPIRLSTSPIRPHTTPIRLPSPLIRPPTLPIRLPSPLIRPPTLPIRLQSPLIRPPTLPIRLPSSINLHMPIRTLSPMKTSSPIRTLSPIKPIHINQRYQNIRVPTKYKK